MRTLKINSETWLWNVGRRSVVIVQEGTMTKYVVPKNTIGEIWRSPYNCHDDEFKRSITPKHIRAYIDSQRKSI